MGPIKILCIEDSLQDLVLLKRTLTLSSLDFELVAIKSLEELTNHLAKPYDILLSDYHLTGFTALEVIQRVQDEKPHLPVIVVSGAVREEQAADLMRLGARDFVRKDNSARLVPAILRELKESEQRQARLVAEEFTAKILSSTEDCIHVLNTEGFFLSSSLGGNKKLCFHHDHQGQNRSFLDLWQQPQDLQAASAALAAARQGKVGKFTGLHELSSESKWWNVVITPILGSGPSADRLLMVARDVSFERQALVQAESANQMKTAFLANMSHEIRTPIGAMMGFSELFLEPSVTDAERADYYKIIKRSGETVLNLLSDILDISKIEAGHLKIEKSAVNLKNLVEETLAGHRLQAEDKGLALVVQYSAELPEMAGTDPTRLKQILSNLLSNAIKFTDKGSVRILAQCRRHENSELLKFEVHDTGLGIQLEDQSKLFKNFSQADNSLQRRFGGTGLGLALSRRLAQALGGDVFLSQSVWGEGSVFTAEIINSVEFQTALTNTKKSAPDSAKSKDALKGVQILVADDSVDNQLLMQRILNMHGAGVKLVGTGREAIAEAVKNGPHVVLMDLQMPDLDGMAATKQLREMHYRGPIVAITAHAMKEDRDRCLNSGFDAYLSKPINTEELVATVSELSVRGDGTKFSALTTSR
jgi:signal transduction histidine kinase/DNA-binding response OmpR family regulator